MYLKLLCTVYLKLPILFTFDGLSLTVWQIDKWWIHFSFSHSVFFWRKLLLPLISLFFCSLYTDWLVWRKLLLPLISLLFGSLYTDWFVWRKLLLPLISLLFCSLYRLIWLDYFRWNYFLKNFSLIDGLLRLVGLPLLHRPEYRM